MRGGRSCSWSWFLGDGCWQLAEALSYFPFAFISRVSYALFFHCSCLLFPPYFPPFFLQLSRHLLSLHFILAKPFFLFSVHIPSLSLHLPNPPSVRCTSYSFHSLQQPTPHSHTPSHLSYKFNTFPSFNTLYHIFLTLLSLHSPIFFTFVSLHRRLQPSFKATCSPSFPNLEKIADLTDAILSLSCIHSLLFSSLESWQP